MTTDTKRTGDHAACAKLLHDTMAEDGCEVTVSEQPPIVAGTYTTDPFTCPHGTTFWIEPTGEQIASWVEAQIP